MTVTLVKATDPYVAEDVVSDVLRGYMAAALWTGFIYEHEGDDNPVPLDRTFTIHDLAATSVEDEAWMDVEAFVTATWPLIHDLDPVQVGHDFLLTRNRHGAGFWDRGLGERGSLLTIMAYSFGTAELASYGYEFGAVVDPIWVS